MKFEYHFLKEGTWILKFNVNLFESKNVFCGMRYISIRLEFILAFHKILVLN